MLLRRLDFHISQELAKRGTFEVARRRLAVARVAFVVVEPGAELTEDELRRWSIEHGPAYAHPRAVYLVDEIPLAGTAKIDKTSLGEQARQRFTPRS